MQEGGSWFPHTPHSHLRTVRWGGRHSLPSSVQLCKPRPSESGPSPDPPTRSAGAAPPGCARRTAWWWGGKEQSALPYDSAQLRPSDAEDAAGLEPCEPTLTPQSLAFLCGGSNVGKPCQLLLDSRKRLRCYSAATLTVVWGKGGCRLQPQAGQLAGKHPHHRDEEAVAGRFMYAEHHGGAVAGEARRGH